MKRRLIACVLAAVTAAFLAPVAFSQTTAIKGYVKDTNGQPIAGAIIQLTNKENGRRYEFKTNKQGEYYSLGINPGRYDLIVIKDKQPIWKMGNITVTFNEPDNVFNVDLKSEQAAQAAALPPEVKKQQEEQEKANEKIKGLNALLAQADANEKAGNYDAAIQSLRETTQLDPTRDVLWGKLADLERIAASKKTDPAERTALYKSAEGDYKKAISIKPTGGYYNNLGEVLVKTGDTAGAMAAYNQAVQVDPTGAGQYYFNEGAVLTNTGKVDEAIAAFDKATQVDPTKADAYYWKGVNLLGKATLKGGKMEAPPGTAEAFNKYLELQPNGQFAAPAKEMLASIGATVETSFGKPKAKPKK